MKRMSLFLTLVILFVLTVNLGLADGASDGLLHGLYAFNASLVCAQAQPDELGAFPPLPHFDPETLALLVEGETATYNMVGTTSFDGNGSLTSNVQWIFVTHQQTAPGSIPAPPQEALECSGSYSVDVDRSVEIDFVCTQPVVGPGGVPLTARFGPLTFNGYLGSDTSTLLAGAVQPVATSVDVLLGETVVSGYQGVCGSVQTYTRISRDPLYFAQFGNGSGGFKSEIVLTNPSASMAASGTVDFLDDAGNPLAVGLATGGNPANSVDFSVDPLGAVTISTDGQGDLKVGSAIASSDQDLGGVIRFSFPGAGIAGFGSSQAYNAFVTPVQRQPGGINTGVAIQNTEEKAVTLNLQLRDQNGNGVPEGTETIPSFPQRGHLAKFINELFPNADTDQFQGTLAVEVTGGRVAASVLELDAAAGKFTTLPVTPLN